MSTEYATATKPEIDDSLAEQQSRAKRGLKATMGRTALGRALHRRTVRTAIAESDIGPSAEKSRKRKRRIHQSLSAMALAGTVAGAAWGGTVAIENNHYNKQTTVESVTPNPIEALLNQSDTHEAFENSTWMVVPGFNMSWHNSRETAKTINKSLGETGDMAWAGFSDKELSTDNLFNKTLQHLKDNNKDEIRLYGCSFGGMLSIELAIRLQEHGIKVPMIVLDSSPATGEDVIDQDGLSWAASPLMGPVPYSARKSYDQHGWDIPQMVSDIYSDLTARNDEERLSSVTVGYQAKYIRDANVQNISDRLSRDTKIVYIGSKDDQTILTDQAYRHYQEMFSDRPVKHFDSSGAGHASPIGDNKIYTPILSSIANEILPHELPGLLLPNMPR